MRITKSDIEKMFTHAVAAYPGECFGFLLGTQQSQTTVHRVIQGSNLQADRNDRFEMDPVEFVRVDAEAEMENWDVVGFYHSHPNWPAIPSQTDLDLAWPGVCHAIVSVRQGQASGLQVWTLQTSPVRRFVPVALEILDEGSVT